MEKGRLHVRFQPPQAFNALWALLSVTLEKKGRHSSALGRSVEALFVQSHSVMCLALIRAALILPVSGWQNLLWWTRQPWACRGPKNLGAIFNLLGMEHGTAAVSVVHLQVFSMWPVLVTLKWLQGDSHATDCRIPWLKGRSLSLSFLSPSALVSKQPMDQTHVARPFSGPAGHLWTTCMVLLSRAVINKNDSCSWLLCNSSLSVAYDHMCLCVCVILRVGLAGQRLRWD